MAFSIRDATPNDAAEIARIYKPIVEETIVSFEEHAPDADEMGTRIARIAAVYPYLVAVKDERVAGYAYASRWRERHAYRFSAEVTVYVDPLAHRSGIGRALYAQLFERLHTGGFHRAFAGISMPNDASVALHRACGFEPVGVYREAGFKFGRWIDVSWWQRAL